MQQQETDVTLSDGNKYRINYTDWGSGDKVLLCVHGLTRNSRDFDYLAKILSQDHGYRVICPDMPGRGKSEYLPHPALYNYVNYNSAILQLIKNLDLKLPIDYLGTSMGGLIAIQIARDNLFNKLILNDVGFFVPRSALIRIARYINIFPKFKNLDEAKTHIKIKMADFGIKSEENWDYLALHSTRVNAAGELTLDYDIHITDGLSSLPDDKIQDLDLAMLWPEVKCNKLLILRGENSDVLPLEIAKKMVNTKANSTLIEFAGTGHAPALMEKEQLNQVVKWLISEEI